jgi:hypothetical protein
MNTIFMRGSGVGLCMALALGAAQAEVAKEAWVARYNGPGSGKDNVQALTVDAAGNAYVTGFSDSGGGDYDFATVKYDADGNEVWVARYDGKSQGADWVKALAVDADANVVVTGSSAGEGTGFDFATLKYDAEGNQLWVRRYDGPAHGDDRVKALAGDAAGNVYVTGESVGPDGLGESVTIKYGPQGDLLWEARSGSPGGRQSLVALAVDADGSVFVAGTATPEVGNTDFVIIKYDPWGKALWTAYRDWSVHDDARYLALDDIGNAYVAGARVSYAEQPEEKAHEDLVIVKYGPDGEELWSTSFNGGDGSNDVASALQLDRQGGIYLGGTSLPSAGDSRGLPAAAYVTVKYDADGNLLWEARYEGLEETVGMAQGLALDAAGNAYVSGASQGPPGQIPAVIVVKYGSHGGERRLFRRDEMATAANNGVYADAAGTVWVSGNDSDGRDYLTAQYVESANAAQPETGSGTGRP